MSRHWLPWRPDVRSDETEEDCEDPERLVVFDDIRSLIFEVRSVENRLNLILNLFSLIRNENDKAISNNFPSQSLLSHRIQQYELESFYDMGSRSVLDDLYLVDCCSTIEINKESLYQFIDNGLHQAIGQFDGNSRTRLTLLWIQLRVIKIKSMEEELKKDKKVWKNTCKELKKWIKDILKEAANRNNILLWEAYATVEALLGNKEDSLNVLDTVLAMNILPGGLLNVKDSITRCQICKLCRSYVEREIGIPKSSENRRAIVNRERALLALSSLADNEQYKPLEKNSKIAPAKILRVRKNYQVLADQLLEDHTTDIDSIMTSLPEAGSSLVHTVVCYAYFQYLTVDVHAASVVFQQVMMQF